VPSYDLNVRAQRAGRALCASPLSAPQRGALVPRLRGLCPPIRALRACNLAPPRKASPPARSARGRVPPTNDDVWQQRKGRYRCWGWSSCGQRELSTACPRPPPMGCFDAKRGIKNSGGGVKRPGCRMHLPQRFCRVTPGGSPPPGCPLAGMAVWYFSRMRTDAYRR